MDQRLISEEMVNNMSKERINAIFSSPTTYELWRTVEKHSSLNFEVQKVLDFINDTMLRLIGEPSPKEKENRQDIYMFTKRFAIEEALNLVVKNGIDINTAIQNVLSTAIKNLNDGKLQKSIYEDGLELLIAIQSLMS